MDGGLLGRGGWAFRVRSSSRGPFRVAASGAHAAGTNEQLRTTYRVACLQRTLGSGAGAGLGMDLHRGRARADTSPRLLSPPRKVCITERWRRWRWKLAAGAGGTGGGLRQPALSPRSDHLTCSTRRRQGRRWRSFCTAAGGRRRYYRWQSGTAESGVAGWHLAPCQLGSGDGPRSLLTRSTNPVPPDSWPDMICTGKRCRGAPFSELHWKTWSAADPAAKARRWRLIVLHLFAS